MNIVDILILAILAFSLLAGMHKGFMASLLRTIGFVGSWFGARMVYERIANLALSNNTLMAMLNQYLEPEGFFASAAQASTTVAEVVSGGEAAIQGAVSTVAGKISIIARAFEANIRNQAFANLNITTLSDYLDQTIWQAVFNVMGFIVAFIVIYAVVSLVVNLLDSVIRFPVLRMFDWLLGGVCGLLRGLVVAVLVLCVMPTIVSVMAPDLIETLLDQSALYGVVTQLDFLDVSGMITQLIG